MQGAISLVQEFLGEEKFPGHLRSAWGWRWPEVPIDQLYSFLIRRTRPVTSIRIFCDDPPVPSSAPSSPTRTYALEDSPPCEKGKPSPVHAPLSYRKSELHSLPQSDEETALERLECVQVCGGDATLLNLLLTSCPNLRILRFTFSTETVITVPEKIPCDLRLLDLNNVVACNQLILLLSRFTKIQFLRINSARVEGDDFESPSCCFSSLRSFHLFFSSHSAESRRFTGAVFPEIAKSCTLRHLTLPYFPDSFFPLLPDKLISLVALDWAPTASPDAFRAFLAKAAPFLQSLVMHARGSSAINLDFILWSLTKCLHSCPQTENCRKCVKKPSQKTPCSSHCCAHVLPDLKRFELSVVMGDNCEMKTPDISVEWAVYFRCKYKHAKFFRKTDFSISMHRSWVPVHVASPAELFGIEIAGWLPSDAEQPQPCRGGCGGGESSACSGVCVQRKWDAGAKYLKAWEGLSEARRMDYVDVFDRLFGSAQVEEPMWLRIDTAETVGSVVQTTGSKFSENSFSPVSLDSLSERKHLTYDQVNAVRE